MTTQPETKPGEETTPRPAAYELAHEPDGRSWTVRENLTDIIERELLGPANGPKELLKAQPDIAYLVGRIAPVKLTDVGDDPSETGSDTAATDVGDAVDASQVRGVPVTAVEEGATAVDEGDVDDAPQKRGLIFASSMGLRFQVPIDLESFRVEASWGCTSS